MKLLVVKLLSRHVPLTKLSSIAILQAKTPASTRYIVVARDGLVRDARSRLVGCKRLQPIRLQVRRYDLTCGVRQRPLDGRRVRVGWGREEHLDGDSPDLEELMETHILGEVAVLVGVLHGDRVENTSGGGVNASNEANRSLGLIAAALCLEGVDSGVLLGLCGVCSSLLPASKLAAASGAPNNPPASCVPSWATCIFHI